MYYFQKIQHIFYHNKENAIESILGLVNMTIKLACKKYKKEVSQSNLEQL